MAVRAKVKKKKKNERKKQFLLVNQIERTPRRKYDDGNNNDDDDRNMQIFYVRAYYVCTYLQENITVKATNAFIKKEK